MNIDRIDLRFSMKEHIIPSIVASVLACGVAVGAVAVWHKPVSVVSYIGSKPMTARKASLVAKTTWPEMDQANIDKLTAAVKDLPGEHRVTIFCIEESKCGDLALNLDNAFESAHWQSDVQDYPMIGLGISSSSQALVNALNASGLVAHFDLNVQTIHGAAIAIGTRYTP